MPNLRTFTEYAEAVARGEGRRVPSQSEGSRSRFSPGRLRMARDLVGIGQRALGQTANVTAAAVSLYERGAATPTDKSLELFAKRLNVGVEFFYGPYERIPIPAFFRSLRGASAIERRRARHRTEIVRDLVETLEAEVRLPDLDVPWHPVREGQAEQPAVAARLVRDTWGLRPGPIDNVVRAVERHGVVVVRPRSQQDTRIDAYSVRFSRRPVIVMSAAKGKRDRSRFDVSHELGHVTMHDPADAAARWVEKQAHQFAAEFLMPAQDIRRDLEQAETFGDLFDLKRKWGVSLAALTLRQRDLGVIDYSTYTNRMKAMSARGWRRHEPVHLGEPESPVLLKKAMDVAGLNEKDLADRTGFTIEIIRDVLDSFADTRPPVEI